MDVEILENGLIKITTNNNVSAPNHQSAEAFYSTVARLTGGESKRERIGKAHTHTHEHVHKKEEQK